VNSEPNPDQLPPIAAKPTARMIVRGRGLILFVTAYCAFASLFYLYVLRRAGVQWGNGRRDWLVVGELIQAAGAIVFTLFLWRYATAIKRYNLNGETAAAKLEAAHLALWRSVAVFLVLIMLYMTVIVSLPAIPPPDKTGQEPVNAQP
jgi:hypothetical protein